MRDQDIRDEMREKILHDLLKGRGEVESLGVVLLELCETIDDAAARIEERLKIMGGDLQTLVKALMEE